MAQSQSEMDLRAEIHDIALFFHGYGYRRITVELRNRGWAVNGKRVLGLMRTDNLLCVRKRLRIVTTNSQHGHHVYPNLAKDIEVTGPNQLWVADITYIRLVSEFVYLAVIIDVFSRKCIGRELGRSLEAQLALDALLMALETRWHEGLEGLVHHSDRGVQYASKDYTGCLKKHDIQISMSRKGNPYDNAFCESFIKTLKYEEVLINEYETFEEAQEGIDRFIDVVYNDKRLHSAIGYLSPNAFEESYINKCA